MGDNRDVGGKMDAEDQGANENNHYDSGNDANQNPEKADKMD